jgi:shikimate dehydrogenase
VAVFSDLDPGAAAIGAVNLLLRDGDRWRGANTDAEGFCRSVEDRGVDLTGRVAAVIGTGGAARAVAVGLAMRGAREIRLLGRRSEATTQIARTLRTHFPAITIDTGPIRTEAIAGAERIVIATSGRPEAIDRLDPSALAPGAAWVDLNYWDPDPPGFAAAARAGCTVIDGHGMLSWQAALSFERWIGVLPDVGSAGTRAR